LISTRTAELKDEFAKGKLDLILTTESETAKGGEKLASYPLKWFCQRGNTQIWKKRPLPLAYEQRCIFRKHAIDSLDAKNIPWDLAFVTASCVDCIPYISAGLAIVAVLQGTEPEDWQEIPASAGLPKLSEFMIYLYVTDGPECLLAHHLARIARDAFLYWVNYQS